MFFPYQPSGSDTHCTSEAARFQLRCLVRWFRSPASVFRSGLSILLATVLCIVGSSTVLGGVEAVKGKRYVLSPQNGLWMIMVAAISDVPEERRTEDGLTAWEAADLLVYELRRQGIPAYTWLQSMEVDTVKSFSASRASRDERKYIARHEAIAVLAGNFPTPEDKDAKQILSFIKHDFQPSFLSDKRSGGILPQTPGRPGPLARAHMTVNPLLSVEDVKRRSVDPLVRSLNADMEYSLLKNPGRYSLKVATFTGGSVVQVGNQVSEKAQSFFERGMGSSLDESAVKAWELTEALRMASKLGYDRNFDAWVYHDRYRSVVTVGSFDRPDDPRLEELRKAFSGKERTHEGREVLTAEVFSIPKNLKPGQQPEKLWMFDVDPRPIEVPGWSGRNE